MKKVGIITIHYVDNLGGVLLAYALQETVGKMGYCSQIINYDPTIVPSKCKHILASVIKRISSAPRYLLNFNKYSKLFFRNKCAFLPPRHLHKSFGIRKIRFDRFRVRYLRLSEHCYLSCLSLEEDPPKYDAYITGSDQVWNPYMCKKEGQAQNDHSYFLTFAPQAKRISYAPSISIPKIPEELRYEMIGLLDGIPFLSCREKQGADLIREMTGRGAEVVLDPTLLLDVEEWERIAIEPEIKEPYILGYFLGEGQDCRKFTTELAQATGCRVVIISREVKEFTESSYINASDSGPAEFLGFVKNALCICTDSFHGTIFSINFSRPFYAFERPGSDGVQSMSSRIYNILQLLGLTDRIFSSGVKISNASLEMDYSYPQKRLIAARADSFHYLEKALTTVTGN